MLGCEEVMILAMHTETDPTPRASRPPEFMERAMVAYGASVYRLALNQTRSPHDAEDVSQDVFLRLLRDKTNFVDNNHLKAWLLRVTINRCLEVRRSAWKRRSVIGGEEMQKALSSSINDDPLDDPEARALSRLTKSPLWKAMDELPEAWRLAVHLHHVEGYSTEEVAQLTHCKAATIRTRLHRARKRMRDALEKQRNETVESRFSKERQTTEEVAHDDEQPQPVWNIG